MPQTHCKPAEIDVYEHFTKETEKANKKLTKIDKKNGNTKNNEVMQNAKMPIGKPMP